MTINRASLKSEVIKVSFFFPFNLYNYSSKRGINYMLVAPGDGVPFVLVSNSNSLTIVERNPVCGHSIDPRALAKARSRSDGG